MERFDGTLILKIIKISYDLVKKGLQSNEILCDIC